MPQYAIQPFTFGDAIQRAVYDHLDRRDQLQRDEALATFRRAQIRQGDERIRQGDRQLTISERAAKEQKRQFDMNYLLEQAAAKREQAQLQRYLALNPLYDPNEAESLRIGAQQDLGEMGLNQFLQLTGQADQRDVQRASVAQARRANDIQELTQQQILEALRRGFDPLDRVEAEPLPPLERPEWTDRVSAGVIGSLMTSSVPGARSLGNLLAPLMPSTEEMYGTTAEAREQQYLGRAGAQLARAAEDVEGMLPPARQEYLRSTPQGQATAESIKTLMRLSQTDPAVRGGGLGLRTRLNRDFRNTFAVEAQDYLFPTSDPTLEGLLEGAIDDEDFGSALKIYNAMNQR